MLLFTKSCLGSLLQSIGKNACSALTGSVVSAPVNAEKDRSQSRGKTKIRCMRDRRPGVKNYQDRWHVTLKLPIPIRLSFSLSVMASVVML